MHADPILHIPNDTGLRNVRVCRNDEVELIGNVSSLDVLICFNQLISPVLIHNSGQNDRYFRRLENLRRGETPCWKCVRSASSYSRLWHAEQSRRHRAPAFRIGGSAARERSLTHFGRLIVDLELCRDGGEWRNRRIHASGAGAMLALVAEA